MNEMTGEYCGTCGSCDIGCIDCARKREGCWGVTNREEFLSVFSTAPLIKTDALIVLCGEDAGPRLATAIELFRTGGAPVIVFSGGIHNLPSCIGAKDLSETALAKGLAPDRILVEPASRNTREQALNVIDLAVTNDWKSITLVASPYHAPRAFLTFLQALHDTEKDKDIQLVNTPGPLFARASKALWWESPDGVTETRLELAGKEFEKIDYYGTMGHVASYKTGLIYLKHWEGQ